MDDFKVIQCPKCGASILAEEKFCSSCGQNLSKNGEVKVDPEKIKQAFQEQAKKRINIDEIRGQLKGELKEFTLARSALRILSIIAMALFFIIAIIMFVKSGEDFNPLAFDMLNIGVLCLGNFCLVSFLKLELYLEARSLKKRGITAAELISSTAPNISENQIQDMVSTFTQQNLTGQGQQVFFSTPSASNQFVNSNASDWATKVVGFLDSESRMQKFLKFLLIGSGCLAVGFLFICLGINIFKEFLREIAPMTDGTSKVAAKYLPQILIFFTVGFMSVMISAIFAGKNKMLIVAGQMEQNGRKFVSATPITTQLGNTSNNVQSVSTTQFGDDFDLSSFDL